MINDSPIPFKRNVVDPIECLKGGWNLVKDQYWLFVGMCAIGVVIAGVVPLGILMGPMMCGMYISFLQKRRGQQIEFGTLFKGFDYFGPSVIATLLHIVPIMIIFIPSYILFYAGFVLTMLHQGNEPDPSGLFAFMGIFVVFWLAMILVIIMISIGFTFVYPLIVDRGLSGVDAVKLSFKAAIANFWRLLGLAMLGFVMSFSVVLCYVGIFLVFPITYSALAIAYEQVFGLNTAGPTGPYSTLPPPPPAFN